MSGDGRRAGRGRWGRGEGAHGDARREADGADEAGGRLEELRGPARRRRVADLPDGSRSARKSTPQHVTESTASPAVSSPMLSMSESELIRSSSSRPAAIAWRERFRGGAAARRLPALRRHKVVLRDDLDERAAGGGAVGEGAVQPTQVALVDRRRLVQRRRLRLAPERRLGRRNRRAQRLARGLGRPIMRMPRIERHLDGLLSAAARRARRAPPRGGRRRRRRCRARRPRRRRRRRRRGATPARRG